MSLLVEAATAWWAPTGSLGGAGALLAGVLGVVVIVTVVVLVGLRRTWRRVALVVDVARWRVHATGARWVRIAVPARVDPDAAAAWWTQMLGLLNPAPRAADGWVRRVLVGQPLLGFEYLSTARSHAVRLWVPGTVAPGLVEQAVAAAWPGVRTTTTTAIPDPAPLRELVRNHRDRAAARRPRSVAARWLERGPWDGSAARGKAVAEAAAEEVAEGGVLRLAKPAALPIQTLRGALPGQKTVGHDPVSALFAATEPLSRGERVVVQILARPVSEAHLGRILRRTRPGQASAGARGRIVARGLVLGVLDLLLGLLREILDLLRPGPVAGRGSRAPSGPRAGARRSATNDAYNPSGVGREHLSPAQSLAASAVDRAAAAKARGSGYRTLLRYAVISPPPASPHTPDRDGPVRDGAVGDRGVGDSGVGDGAVGDGGVGDRVGGADPVRARVRAKARAVAGVFAAYGDLNHYRRVALDDPVAALGVHHLGRVVSEPDPRRRRELGTRRERREAHLDGRGRRGDLLSIAELAAIAHLPHRPDQPRLERAGARIAAPHPDIPSDPPGTPGVIALGSTPTPSSGHHAGEDTGRAGQVGGAGGRPVGLRVADAMLHTHMLGLTGAGKSTLLVRRALACIDDGRGLLFMDNKGDAVTEILARLDAEQRRRWPHGRLIVLEPTGPASGRRSGPGAAPVPVLNPLAPAREAAGQVPGSGGDMAVAHTVAVLSKLYTRYWGPRTDDLLRVCCLTLRHDPHQPASLAEVARLLLDPRRRARAAARLPPGSLLREFWVEHAHLPDSAWGALRAPLLNKLRPLTLPGFTAGVLNGGVLNGGASSVDLAAVLDHGGILLARLPKGVLGEENSRLVGSLILAQTWQAITTRIAQPSAARRPAELVVDEAQNFLHLPGSIDDMLAEARGYRVGITLAHQHLGQLPAELRRGVVAHTRNKIYFALGVDDAAHLAAHTRPDLDADDLTRPDAHHATARLVVDGQELPAFTLRTHDLPPPLARNPSSGPNPNPHPSPNRRPDPARPGPRPDPPRPRFTARPPGPRPAG